MREERTRSPHFPESALKCFTYGNYVIDAADQFSFHAVQDVAIKTRPFSKIVDAVIGPAHHGKLSHQVRGNGQRRNRVDWLRHRGNQWPQLPRQKPSIEFSRKARFERRPHARIHDFQPVGQRRRLLGRPKPLLCLFQTTRDRRPIQLWTASSNRVDPPNIVIVEKLADEVLAA